MLHLMLIMKLHEHLPPPSSLGPTVGASVGDFYSTPGHIQDQVDMYNIQLLHIKNAVYYIYFSLPISFPSLVQIHQDFVADRVKTAVVAGMCFWVPSSLG